jgi:hypothetical protein
LQSPNKGITADVCLLLLQQILILKAADWDRRQLHSSSNSKNNMQQSINRRLLFTHTHTSPD